MFLKKCFLCVDFVPPPPIAPPTAPSVFSDVDLFQFFFFLEKKVLSPWNERHSHEKRGQNGIKGKGEMTEGWGGGWGKGQGQIEMAKGWTNGGE